MRAKIIAELSANHNQDINIARQSIRIAKESGADAIKLQTYTADTMTIDCNNDYFMISQDTIWDGRTLYDLYREAFTPWEWHQNLFDYATEIGIEIFSTPFDYTAVDLLENLKTPLYKIASFEIADIPLIKYVASKKKPIILSVGIATIQEIEEAVSACREEGNNDITILQCTSQYPAKVEDANLMTMIDIKDRFNVKIGLSDHTIGYEVPVIAVAMGASLIEKHFTIDRNIGGPDATFSMMPIEFKEMVKQIRKVEKIIGGINYDVDDKKLKSRVFARSLFVVQDVKVGETVTKENVKSIRPGYGISPKYIEIIMGKCFKQDVARGTPVSWELLES